jgi:hypothetical protein
MVNGDGSDKQFTIVGKSKTPQITGDAFWKKHGLEYYYNTKGGWIVPSL